MFRVFHFSALLSLAFGAPSNKIVARQDASAAQLLLVGGGPSGTIAAATFDGAIFTVVANDTRTGTSPSWLLFKEPNLLYAVDENSNTTRVFNFDNTTNTLNLVQNATGSSGVVHLEFGLRRDRIVAAAFGQGQIDVWDVSAPDGSLVLLKQIPSNGTLGPNEARQDAPHPHQAVLDHSGRFFLVNDLGTDTILVIDSLDDAFDVVNNVRVPSPGCGPRHGAFFPATGSEGAEFATHYLLVCEMLNIVLVFQLEYGGLTGLAFTPTQNISTFGAAFPPVNLSSSTAGEIVVAKDNSDVYVSNRNTGNDTDSISHFAVDKGPSGDIQLRFVDNISSGGKVPRMFSLSEDGAENLLFSTNQDGDLGLLAFARGTDGALSSPAASVQVQAFGAQGMGPQFVQQI